MQRAATRSQCSEESLYVALDLGWKSWKLAMTVGLGQKPRLRSLPAGDTKRLQRELEMGCARFGVESGRIVSCFEAGRDGFWLHRYLESIGVESHVVDAASLEVNRRGRRTKTDRVDAEGLVRRLVRYDEGEQKVWSVVKVPSVEQEDARHLHRQLGSLKQEQTRLINRIKGLLAAQGLRGEPRRRDFLAWLEQARLWDGSAVPAALRRRIEIEHARLEFLREQIRTLERERSQRLQHEDSAVLEKVRRLQQLKGIGPSSAWLFVMELFGWREFQNRKQVGSIAGLTPTPFQTGQSAREQGISKAGNRRVRSMAVQIAWGWLRFQPDSALSQWYQKRFADGPPRMRRIGIVAVARKLLVALWMWVEHGVLPEGAEITS
jgi:transposase